MSDVTEQLQARFADALAVAFGDDHRDADAILRPSNHPKFGDYQANCAMSLGKTLGLKPRDVAQKLVDALKIDDLCGKVEIAGPGFINLTLSDQFINSQLGSLAGDQRLGVSLDEPRKVVVDYSSPNVAKEMHVGHLRSTIIGDAIVRVLEYQGHDVIRQNHLGDWGTQFGMLIENLIDMGFDSSQGMSPAELTKIYKESKKRFDDDPDFAERARKRVVSLQGGDEQSGAVWNALVEASKRYFQTVYDRMNVRLKPQDACGESFYNDRLPGIVQRLKSEGQLVESDGAQVAYPEGFKDRDDNPLPMIVQKTDGGYLYATTDLAAAMYRTKELKADRIVYVIGLPQKQHFEMFTTALRQFGWVDDNVRMEFVGFGSVLGDDGKMFRTRSGDTVRLIDLLEEAEQRAASVIEQKNPELPEEERRTIAHAVGIGALKYADLSGDRVKDYVFSWDRMLSFDGNTAPYLQYSYTRIRSIFRKSGLTKVDGGFIIGESAERLLALKLFQFSSVVDSVAESLEPHRMCTYLYELAANYHQFYEQCPVLKAPDDATRDSRLQLSDLAARVLKTGLGLLGIETVEQM